MYCLSVRRYHSCSAFDFFFLQLIITGVSTLLETRASSFSDKQEMLFSIHMRYKIDAVEFNRIVDMLGVVVLRLDLAIRLGLSTMN